MKGFSRNMDQYPDVPIGIKGGVIMVILITLLGVWVYNYPEVLLIILAFYIIAITGTLQEEKRFKRIKEVRVGESICTFTRSLPYREIDPWIIRAVWDGCQDFLGAKKDGYFPIRTTDKLDDFFISDDIVDLLEKAASRSKRSFIGEEKNPLYGKVDTVGDLIHFLNKQPEILN